MTRRIRRQLTQEEWYEIGSMVVLADTALSHLQCGLLHAVPVKVCDQWRKVQRVLSWELKNQAKELMRDQYGIELRIFSSINRSQHEWEKTRSIRKRRMTRTEWVIMGEDVKVARNAIMSCGLKIQVQTRLDESRKWFRLIDRIDHLKCHLDSVAFDQHPGWEEFSRVFYGSNIGENPKLITSLACSPEDRIDPASGSVGRKPPVNQ